MHWQQDIVGFPREVMKNERQVAERVRSHSLAAIVAPNKAREAADA